MNAFVFLATGFEEIEAMATADILLRGGVSVTMVSITGDLVVQGAHGLPVVAEKLFEQVTDFSSADLLVLPGGLPGSDNLQAHPGLRALLVSHDKQGKRIAAICAAPRVLGSLGLLKGKSATCYPGTEPLLTGAIFENAPVVSSGNIITGKGPGFVFEFALKLVESLQGKAKAEEVASGLLLH
ncbi:MAG: DJ-1/PfpI family protein [Dysgonamonadaceae bacterium]|jgi:4-methyl-5(b-hydroxyethyl)-thiazole monophosphate biosynthesis|nr:DJ-1/PfpI family protein [Dysgonamonadaceae bacterium]